MRPSTAARYCLLSLTLALALISGCAKPKPVVPASFNPYTSSDKAFVCDAPAGWSVDGYGSGATSSGVTFKSADAKINVDSDEQGSFMGDALTNPMTSGLVGGGSVAGGSPVDKLHAMNASKVSDNVDGYVELSTTAATLPYGPTRWTLYSGKDVRGYRLTILGHDRCITINCQCTPAEWAALTPVFQRVIFSVKQGPGS